MPSVQGQQTSEAQAGQALLDMVPKMDGQLSPDTKICESFPVTMQFFASLACMHRIQSHPAQS